MHGLGLGILGNYDTIRFNCASKRAGTRRDTDWVIANFILVLLHTLS